MKKIKLFRPITLLFNELKLVEWLTFKQVQQYTLLVLVICFIVGIIIIAFDSGFFFLRDLLLKP